MGRQNIKPSTYPKKIMSGFKGIGIWPINPSNSKFDPSTLYTLQNQAMEEEEAK